MFVEILKSMLAKDISKTLPNVDIYEQCSLRTYRILGLNPGPYTLQGTNTWLITGNHSNGDSGGDHILIDTGEARTADKYVPYLLDHIFPITKTKRLSKILLTHSHKDHQGGVKAILEGLKVRGMFPLPTIHKRNIPGGGKYPNMGFESIHINDKEIFKIDNSTTLETVYLPGHTDDSIGFILHEDNALVTGDCILGCGTTIFDNLSEYMDSLKTIHNIIIANNHLCGDCNSKNNQGIHTIYPGHGPVIKHNAVNKVEEYINHRVDREDEIMFILKQYKKNDRYLTSFEIVTSIYGPLNIIMKASAQYGILQHLDKLRNDKKIEFLSPDLWRIKL